MKLIATSLLFLWTLSVAMAQAPEPGRLYLDHLSLVPPANWAQHVFATNVMFIAPAVGVGADSCSINLSSAGGSGGGPLELIAAIDNNTPANLLREPVAPPRTLGNGWTVAGRVYRNQYVPQKFKHVVVITKGNQGQMVSLDYEYGACAALLDATFRTLQVNDQPRRLQPSGAPLALLAPSRQDVPATATRSGVVCRAGGISCLNGGPVGSSCMCASTAGPQLGTVFDR